MNRKNPLCESKVMKVRHGSSAKKKEQLLHMYNLFHSKKKQVEINVSKVYILGFIIQHGGRMSNQHYFQAYQQL